MNYYICHIEKRILGFFLDIDKKRLGLGSHIAQKISNPLSSGLSLAGAWSRICRCGNKHAEMVDGRKVWPGLLID